MYALREGLVEAFALKALRLVVAGRSVYQTVVVCHDAIERLSLVVDLALAFVEEVGDQLRRALVGLRDELFQIAPSGVDEGVQTVDHPVGVLHIAVDAGYGRRLVEEGSVDSVVVAVDILVVVILAELVVEEGSRLDVVHVRLAAHRCLPLVATFLVGVGHLGLQSRSRLEGAEVEHLLAEVGGEVGHMVALALVVGRCCIQCRGDGLVLVLVGYAVAPEDGVQGEVVAGSPALLVLLAQGIVVEVVDGGELQGLVLHHVAVHHAHHRGLRCRDDTTRSLTGISIGDVRRVARVDGRGQYLVVTAARLVVVEERVPHVEMVVGGDGTASRPGDEALVVLRLRTHGEVLREV